MIKLGKGILLWTSSATIIRFTTTPPRQRCSVRAPFGCGGTEEYAPILQVLTSAADAKPATLTLDLRTLQFLNSSGVTTLSKFVLQARKHNVSQVVIKGSKQFPWQEKSLKNLQRLLPGLQLEIE